MENICLRKNSKCHISSESVTESSTKEESRRHLCHSFFTRCLKYFRRNPLLRKRIALVNKSGQYSIGYRGRRPIFFIKDFYLTLLDLQWRWAIFCFFIMYFTVFLFFTLVWCTICWINGDFDRLGEPGYEPCVKGMTSFSGLLLFSIETQTSIGYGFVYPNTSCTGSLVVLFFQITVGLIAETFLLTYIVSKFFRPSKRAKTIRFSEFAVICKEGGFLCLQVRIGDLRGKSLHSVSAQGVLVRESKTDEGFVYPLYQRELLFAVDKMEEDICLLWPVLLTHKITQASPFWTRGPFDLKRERFEILIFLEGVVEATGELCQARTSYCHNEIFWGYRFQQILKFHQSTKRWCIDFNDFDKIIKVPTPDLSAKRIDAVITGTNVLENPQYSAPFPEGISEQSFSLFNSTAMTSYSRNHLMALTETSGLSELSQIQERRFSI